VSACHHKAGTACPFAFTDHSETVQNYGCLPTLHNIRDMRVVHGRTWACHDDQTVPCAGAIAWLHKEGLPHTVVDPVLLTENDPWHLFIDKPLTPLE